jgi:bacterioferritin
MVRYLGDADPTTRVLMEGILAKEEEHAKDLVDLLATLDPTRPA